MLNNLINLQEDISSIRWSIKEDQYHLIDRQLEIQKEFEKTKLFQKYKLNYESVILEYIDEETIELSCNDIVVELNIKDCEF